MSASECVKCFLANFWIFWIVSRQHRPGHLPHRRLLRCRQSRFDVHRKYLPPRPQRDGRHVDQHVRPLAPNALAVPVTTNPWFRSVLPARPRRSAPRRSALLIAPRGSAFRQERRQAAVDHEAGAGDVAGAGGAQEQCELNSAARMSASATAAPAPAKARSRLPDRYHTDGKDSRPCLRDTDRARGSETSPSTITIRPSSSSAR